MSLRDRDRRFFVSLTQVCLLVTAALGFAGYLLLAPFDTAQGPGHVALLVSDAAYSTARLFILEGPEDLATQGSTLAVWMVGVARLLVKEGAQLTLSDVHEDRAEALAQELGAETAAPDAIMSVACDVFSPNALGAILDDAGIARLDCQIVAGGANNQLQRPEHGPMLAERGILYAPDYVINAGGIISVTLEYLCRCEKAPCDINEVRKRIAMIPGRLEEIWRESDASGASPDQVADRMAQQLIGRA